MDPVEALERIATLLERERAGRYKEEAFRKAADAIRGRPLDELRELAATGRLGDLPGIGSSTARVVDQALAGEVPEYLARLEAEAAPDSGPGAPIRAALQGDLHLHSDWSDGGATIEQMARKGAELGHAYLALTDHSPSLTVAHGLDAERLESQLALVARLNEELAPFRILTGVEVDILEDGRLDQDSDLLAELDVVVASVHSKLRMSEQPMTDRMVAAMANPNTDILGHCTGRMVLGKGRPESTFDADLVFAACARLRQGGRDQLSARAARSADAVAGTGRRHRLQGVDRQRRARGGSARVATVRVCRAAEAGVPVERIVNSWPAEQLLEWTASHS